MAYYISLAINTAYGMVYQLGDKNAYGISNQLGDKYCIWNIISTEK